jgi:putative ABC transport system ATP-binding protein
VLARLRHVRKVFSRGTREVVALEDLSLDIAEGESVAIMGPSGSGKSTFLSILGCLDQPSSGEYLLDGTPVHALTDDALSRIRNQRIGFVFQSFHLIPQLTVAENVATPLLYRGVSETEAARVAAASLERVGILKRAEHRPTELSGGEAQRAAIARALVTEPRVLLADEPTGNLDSVTGEEIARLLEELHADGRTIVLVTHNEALALRAERVVHLGDGRLQREERPA